MSKLISRGVVLTISRFSNFAILLLSPMLLVRILDVEAFGQYREFVLYSAILMTISEFAINSSLTYFTPREPDKERLFITQASLLVFLTSVACVAALVISRPWIVEHLSYDFVAPMAAYVFFFVNLNALEYYWIARRRTDLVLYYSGARVLLRVTVLVTVAYITRDVDKIILSLVAAEALRLIVVFALMIRMNLFTRAISKQRLWDQVRFIAPMGLSQIVQQVSRDFGKIIIASRLGPASLALYAVGSYLLPVVRLVRGSIADVLFPEMVRKNQDHEGAVRLWRRATVMYCVLLFPAFVLLVSYAEVFIGTLFTEKYLVAVPLFQIYSLVLLRRCFNFDILLRASGRTGQVLTGRLVQLVVSTTLALALYQAFGFVGPAIAFVASDLVMELYYVRRVLKSQSLNLRELVDWRGILMVALACILALPILPAAGLLPVSNLLCAIIAAPVYTVLAFFLAWRFGVSDIRRLADFVTGVMASATRQSSRSR